MSQESDFSDDSPVTWIQWFCGLDDHQFFSQINEEYIKQPFNLYGLSKRINKYNKALAMILRTHAPLEEEIQDPQFLQIYQEATELYGLIHSRYIATPQGLAIMRQKYLAGKFGTCPRVLCEKQNVIPVGISQDIKLARVKIYCPRCKDIFVPKKKFADVDGAYFGTSFPQLLLMTYPDITPVFEKQEYIPTIFGFKVEQEKTKESNLIEKHNQNFQTNQSDIMRATTSQMVPRKKKNKKKR